MSSSAPVAVVTSREEALVTYGVSYEHYGAFSEPIVEKLGGVETAAPTAARRFATEKSAIAHVQEIAARVATVELTIAEGKMAASSGIGIWLAENWKAARNREVGRLATKAILSGQAKDLRAIIEDGYKPEIKRLPARLRLPALLPLGQKVWIVDASEFPARPARVVEDRIVSRTIVDDLDHPLFHAVCRYKLETRSGFFACDYALSDPLRLDCATELFRGRLTRQEAEDDLEEFDRKIRSALDQDADRDPLDVACANRQRIIPENAEELWNARFSAPPPDAFGGANDMTDTTEMGPDAAYVDPVAATDPEQVIPALEPARPAAARPSGDDDTVIDVDFHELRDERPTDVPGGTAIVIALHPTLDSPRVMNPALFWSPAFEADPEPAVLLHLPALAPVADGREPIAPAREPRRGIVVRIKAFLNRFRPKRADDPFPDLGAEILALPAPQPAVATPPDDEPQADAAPETPLQQMTPLQDFMACGYTVRRPSTISMEESLITLLRDRLGSAA